MVKILELFAGTKSISKAFWSKGHKTFTVELDPDFRPDLVADIMELDPSTLPGPFDFIWASPPCTSFTVMQIGRNWEKRGDKLFPKTDGARLGIALLEKTLEIIEYWKPPYFIIENPRGAMRKMDQVAPLERHTITYCQYGESRMKPTDLWGQFPPSLEFKCCKNGAPCHLPAPRGSNKGTQGIDQSRFRSMIPQRFCIEVAEAVESGGAPLISSSKQSRLF